MQGDPAAWRWIAHLALRNELTALAVAEALMIPGAIQRLAAVLLLLCGQSRAPEETGAVEIEISQDDLARMANLSRSSTGRILQAFEADGLVTGGYRQLRIADCEGLRRRRSGE